jgi:hypothetical protein
MTITVDVRPEVEAELARRASLRGMPLEACVATLLEEAVHLPAAQLDLTIVTRNVKDFAGLGVTIFNPWDAV